MTIAIAARSLKYGKQGIEFIPGPREFRGRFDEVGFLVLPYEDC